jgi:hypothetical protein
VSPFELADGGRRWGRSQIIEKAWSSINRSILSASTITKDLSINMTFTIIVQLKAKIPFKPKKKIHGVCRDSLQYTILNIFKNIIYFHMYLLSNSYPVLPKSEEGEEVFPFENFRLVISAL